MPRTFGLNTSSDDVTKMDRSNLLGLNDLSEIAPDLNSSNILDQSIIKELNVKQTRKLELDTSDILEETAELLVDDDNYHDDIKKIWEQVDTKIESLQEDQNVSMLDSNQNSGRNWQNC